MAKKHIIGYQITNSKHELPNGLFSFQIFRSHGIAYKYARQHEDELPKNAFVQIVWSGDLQDPTYIE